VLNYNGFLFEKRDHRGKIKKFANVPDIYNWAHELDTDMALWIADKLVKNLKKFFSKNKHLEDFTKYLKGEKISKKKLSEINKIISKSKSSIEPKIRKVLDYVKSPLHQREGLPNSGKPNINKLTLQQALEKSKEWHDEIKQNADNFLIEEEYGEIMMEFPDGYYWIDLQSTSCESEASAMGHCGNVNNATTLISLRRYKQPHITIGWDENKNIFTQIKGKGNIKPIDKYHKYIVDLICKFEISGFKSEHNRSSDFVPDDLDSDLLIKLEECNPTYIKNSQGLSDDEIEEKYRFDLEDGQWESDIREDHFYASTLFSYVDDDDFLSQIIDSEVDYYSSEEFDGYFDGQENDIRSFLLGSDVSYDDLRKSLDSNLNDDEIEERKNKSEEELLDELKINKLKELLEEFNIKEDFIRESFENRWSDAESYSNEMYGNISGVEFLKMFENYFDVDAFIDYLMQNCDIDHLREQYDS